MLLLLPWILQFESQDSVPEDTLALSFSPVVIGFSLSYQMEHSSRTQFPYYILLPLLQLWLEILNPGEEWPPGDCDFTGTIRTH